MVSVPSLLNDDKFMQFQSDSLLFKQCDEVELEQRVEVLMKLQLIYI